MMRQFRTVSGVSLTASATEMTWGAVFGATGYDVVRGDLATLRSTAGDFAAATQACVLNGQPDGSYNHAMDPALAAGQGYWYLSRTRDAVGKGTFDSGHSSQAGLRDGEIEASGVSCP